MVSKRADENLDDIYDYISNDNYFYPIKVINHIHYTIWYLKDFPYLWKPSFWDLREFVETKYKFRILYKVNENEKYVTIISIFKNI